MSLAIAAATADPIVALHPLVPPGFTHQVVPLAGIAKPANSPTQSTIVAATERMFPFIAIPPILFLELIPGRRIISPPVGTRKEK
jgi:hypothetical protein